MPRYTEAEAREAVRTSFSYAEALRKVGLRPAGGVRLYAAGLKERRCEMCGQGEVWRDCFMGLILDHVNGVPDDTRIENLRVLCPNCNATLQTHCGRRNREPVVPRDCLHCGASFEPRFPRQRYCSRVCGRRSRGSRDPHLERRKVERPAYEQLMSELATSSWSAVARTYGVSDNAVRKWVRWYEADRDDEPASSVDHGRGEKGR